VIVESGLIVALLLQRSQRRRAQRALADRLQFETLLSELSATFITVPASELDREIERGLRRIVERLDVDHASLAELGEGREVVEVTHSWSRQGLTLVTGVVETTAFPWIGSRLLEGHVVRFARPGELPEDGAATDRRSLAGFGTRSLAAVPLVVEGGVMGALSLSTVSAERDWPDELIPRLQLLAEVFANALARRRAESAVRESEERFRLMADAAPIMVWVVGPDGRCTYLNRRWLDFTGRRLEEELEDHRAASVHPDDREVWVEALHAALDARRPFTIEYRLRRWDGQYRWILDHGVPRAGTDVGCSGYIGSAIDVTELRVAQRALIESNALRSAVLGSLHATVAALDREGVIIAVNEAWGQFAATNSADPARVSIGVSYLEVCRRAAALGDPDAARALEAITSVLDGGRVRAQLEYACHSASEERWFEMSVEPFRRPEGGAVVSHVDITRRRKAEEEARRQRDALAHALRVTTLGELAASLAHEINQPLAAIVTNAQVARDLLVAGAEAGSEITEALADIADDARRASEVIRRLRALFRKQHAERQLVDVNQLVADAVDLLQHDVQRKRIGVQLALHQEPLPVLGDGVQLQQVFLNLLVNACEAIAAAADGPREIAVDTVPSGPDRLRVSIRDTGIGVGEEEELERIFGAFVSTKSDGLGMGLSISRSIVEAHGGRIWATRNPDRGVTLHVTLPCAAAPVGP
jgi:two-component system, LuxR family, sensor kinase FixL